MSEESEQPTSIGIGRTPPYTICGVIYFARGRGENRDSRFAPAQLVADWPHATLEPLIMQHISATIQE